MSDTQGAARGGRQKNEAVGDRRRRWHQVRPQPRRRSDLMGFNARLSMALGWLVVIELIVFPFPWVW